MGRLAPRGVNAEILGLEERIERLERALKSWQEMGGVYGDALRKIADGTLSEAQMRAVAADAIAGGASR